MIPARAIQISTQAQDIVVDPFGGGGSTYQEAQGLGRYWIDSEIGDCRAIEERFRSFMPLTIGADPPVRVLEILSGAAT